MAVQKLMKAADLETPGAALRVAPVAVHGSIVLALHPSSQSFCNNSIRSLVQDIFGPFDV